MKEEVVTVGISQEKREKEEKTKKRKGIDVIIERNKGRRNSKVWRASRLTIL